MKNTPSNTAPALHDLLGTKNKKEQAKRVSGLMQQVNVPVVDLVIRFDGRTNQIGVSLVGPSIQADLIYKILDGARDLLKKQEYEAIRTKEDTEQSKSIPTQEDKQ